MITICRALVINTVLISWNRSRVSCLVSFDHIPNHCYFLKLFILFLGIWATNPSEATDKAFSHAIRIFHSRIHKKNYNNKKAKEQAAAVASAAARAAQADVHIII
jgi:hypothetical protein